jgi:hypothetical protein
MLHFQLSRRQHQLVPLSTPLHASLAAVPKSTPIGTHINTTACCTFSCPEVNIRIPSNNNVSIKIALLLTKYKFCPNFFLRCLTQSSLFSLQFRVLYLGSFTSLQLTFDRRMSRYSVRICGDKILYKFIRTIKVPSFSRSSSLFSFFQLERVNRPL